MCEEVSSLLPQSRDQTQVISFRGSQTISLFILGGWGGSTLTIQLGMVFNS